MCVSHIGGLVTSEHVTTFMYVYQYGRGYACEPRWWAC
jgi:hypothetical protein